MRQRRTKTLLEWFPHPGAEDVIDEIVSEINAIEDPKLRAVKVLALMTLHAPSYGDVVLPFAVGHQQACAVLAELQEAGVEEAL